jgi:hypothetical protein
MTEHSYIRSIHDRLRKKAPTIYIWKINDAFQGGVADAYYSGRSDIWIEYKFVKSLPKRVDTRIDPGLSLLQQKWLRDRNAEGRRVCVIIGSPEGSLILPGIDWDREISMADFISHAVEKTEVVAYIEQQAGIILG